MVVHRYNADGSEGMDIWRFRWMVGYAAADFPYGRDDAGLQRWINEHIDAAVNNDIQPLFPIESAATLQHASGEEKKTLWLLDEFTEDALRHWAHHDLHHAFEALLASYLNLLSLLGLTGGKVQQGEQP